LKDAPIKVSTSWDLPQDWKRNEHMMVILFEAEMRTMELLSHNRRSNSAYSPILPAIKRPNMKTPLYLLTCIFMGLFAWSSAQTTTATYDSPPDHVVKIEMHLSAFGVESDGFPSIKA
jgi:hypothetical protein